MFSFSSKWHPKRHHLILAGCVLALAVLGIRFFYPRSAGPRFTASAAAEDQKFQNFTDALFRQDMTASTLNLHYTLKDPEAYGISNTPVTYGAVSANSTEVLASCENGLNALAQFSYEDLSKDHQLTYDILKSHFTASRTAAPYLLYQEPLNATTGLQAQLPVLLSEYQFYTREDIDTYLALLEKTPEYFDSLIRFEQEKSESGLFMSRDAADAVIEQCNSFLGMGDSNYMYTTFSERLDSFTDFTGQQFADYIAKNKSQVDSYVLPAYEKLVQALTDLKDTGVNDKGLYYLPHGREFYTALVAQNTGSSRAVPELQQLTKKQILSDLTGIQDIVTSHQAVSQETSQVLNAMENSLNHPETILSDLETKMSSAFPEAPKVSRDVKYVPEALQDYLSPAFYLIPAIDNSSENVIYINQGQTVDGIELFTTLAHEGYPGHLYQTTYFAATNPDPVRSILNFGGYTEGWATYTEMISYYMSPLSNNQAALLQKNKSAILGLYALADMGIHYDGWTLDETVSFFKNYGISNTDTVKSIYTMILSDPGNYLKYYIGYIEFLELKREQIQKDGEAFSQKEFHKMILETGPAPFDVLKKQLSAADSESVPALFS